jgi:hypothetical protein
MHICASFLRMNAVKLHHRSTFPHCVFKLHLNQRHITWHAVTSIGIEFVHLNTHKFPRKDVKTLIALEDLGRGRSGKAWLASTLSQKPAICVLKFCNDDTGSMQKLDLEKSWWHEVYPEFKKMVKIRMWSGSYALMMPHFCAIPAVERTLYYDSIKDLLTEKFCKKLLIHTDVAWRNFGMYVKKPRYYQPILYDLESVAKVTTMKEALEWVDAAMAKLFAVTP